MHSEALFVQVLSLQNSGEMEEVVNFNGNLINLVHDLLQFCATDYVALLGDIYSILSPDAAT